MSGWQAPQPDLRPSARRRSLIKVLVDFWTRPIPGEPLALFRILLGTVGMACALSSVAPYLDLYLGEEGLCPASAMDKWLLRTGRFCLLRGPTNIPVLHQWLPTEYAHRWVEWGESSAVVVFLFVLWQLAFLCTTLGFHTRVATFLAWLLTVTFHTRLSWVLNGGDALLSAGLFYLMLSPAGAAWSLDHRRRTRKAAAIADGVPQPEAVLIPPWSVRLIQIQLCLVYLFTGLAKIGEDWLNGEAIYWVLNDLSLTRWPYAWLPVPMLLCRLFSWATLLFELGFPLIVLVPRLRPWLLSAGVVFHIGIFASMEVGWFSQITLCWYAVFVSADTMKCFFRRLRTR